MEGEKIRSNKIVKRIWFSFWTLLIIYFIFSINTISVLAKTSDEKDMKYMLTLEERGGAREYINGLDIGLKYSSENPRIITYDEALLQKAFNSLSCLDINKIFKSQNANIVYQNNGYVISREVYGNEINKEILYENIVKAIKNGDTTINLESIKCYKDPQFTADSQKVIYARDILNKYLSSQITYNIAELTQYLDSSTIKDWIAIDGNYQVTIDETKVRNYVDNLASIYTNALGTSIKVSGGYSGNNHSWVVDTDEETNALIENIKNGQTITKSPLYSQTSSADYFSNVGDTFVEIDMAKQHLWYYKDGYLVVDGDVVTGNVSGGCSTPEGVYNLYFKQKDTVLRGPGYASPVCFWMPFNRGIGLHDASWRSEFGGEIYKTSGSHGCVNTSYDVAQAVYNGIHAGDPIICHN